jgi:hypothetical protein
VLIRASRPSSALACSQVRGCLGCDEALSPRVPGPAPRDWILGSSTGENVTSLEHSRPRRRRPDREAKVTLNVKQSRKTPCRLSTSRSSIADALHHDTGFWMPDSPITLEKFAGNRGGVVSVTDYEQAAFDATEPTAVSTWRAVTESPITDEILQWPPDLFALIHVIVERAEAYRFVLSPPNGSQWPPARIASWADAVQQAARRWCGWVEDRQGPLPDLLVQEWRAFRERAGVPLERVAAGREPHLCEALLTLHAIADEACAGLGVALHASDATGCIYRARGRELLARTGSLTRSRSQLLRVLPKVRTSPHGTSLRSLSRYACMPSLGVQARWHKVPARHPGIEPQSDHVNMLLLPWPLRVRESDFRPMAGSVHRLAKEPYGFFQFAPSEKLDLDLVDRVLVAARDEVDSVDVVLLPESAVDEDDIDDLETVLDSHGVIQLFTGVRQRSRPLGRQPGNWVHISFNPKLEKGAPPTSSPGRRWLHIRQNKHHRWSLDEGQIDQYHIGGALHPHIRWWEAMDIPRQSVQFVEFGGVTVVSLVCEDLAQNDNVAELIRSVGPTVVVTHLLDGPQLTSRWAARYASVLADDPGSAVLTLTSFGMVQRARPRGRDASSVVALWKDPARGSREIPLEAGAHAVLTSACAGGTTRRSADGRWPVDNAVHWFDVAIHQIRASTAASGSSSLGIGITSLRMMEVEELSVVTAHAEAVAEAAAYAPERVAALLADARPSAPWRAALGIAKPSPKLSDAIESISRVVQAATHSGGAPTLEALLIAVQDQHPGEQELDRFVRRVLRSTLEQRRMQQAREGEIGERPRPGQRFGSG